MTVVFYGKDKLLHIEAIGIELPRVARHPNRAAFRGVLTIVDAVSERAPAGARGHRVLLTGEAAERALPSLIGMALGYTPKLDGHDARRKIGIITGAEIVAGKLLVEGYLFARDFPDVMRELRSGRMKLGMSYELTDAQVEDVKAAVWKLTDVIFTGAALLERNKAAYENTSIELKETLMNQEESKQFTALAERMAVAAEQMTATVERIEAQREELTARIDRLVAAVEQDESTLERRIAALQQENAELKEKLEKKTSVSASRKTLPASVTALLAKQGLEGDQTLEASALDAAMASLSLEQRIAVKSQLARAGIIA